MTSFTQGGPFTDKGGVESRKLIRKNAKPNYTVIILRPNNQST